MAVYDQWAELITKNVERFVEGIVSFLPGFLGALLLLITGWLLAKILRSLILRLGSGLDRLSQTVGLERRVHWLRTKWPVSRIVAGIVYWLVLLFFIVAAAESLGLPGLAHWIARGIGYLPNLFAAGIILLIGYALAGFARDILTTAQASLGGDQAEILGRSIHALVLTVAVLVAADQLGVDVTLLASLVTIGVAAAAGGLAFAFGLGAGSTVDNLIAARYVRKTYRVGDRVRVKEVEGEILEITTTAVVLDSASGRILIPAKLFSNEASTLMDRQQAADA